MTPILYYVHVHKEVTRHCCYKQYPPIRYTFNKIKALPKLQISPAHHCSSNNRLKAHSIMLACKAIECNVIYAFRHIKITGIQKHAINISDHFVLKKRLSENILHLNIYDNLEVHNIVRTCYAFYIITSTL